MTKPEGRPRGRRKGQNGTLESANQDTGAGILRCHLCGGLIKDHETVVCNKPIDEALVRRQAGLPPRARPNG